MVPVGAVGEESGGRVALLPAPAVLVCPFPVAPHPLKAKWQQLGCMPASPAWEPGRSARVSLLFLLLFLLPVTLRIRLRGCWAGSAPPPPPAPPCASRLETISDA